jgi:hypothetical protein
MADHAPVDSRRRFLTVAATLAGAAVLLRAPRSLAGGAAAPAMVTIAMFANDGTPLGLESLAKVVRADAEWRAQLSPLA